MEMAMIKKTSLVRTTLGAAFALLATQARAAPPIPIDFATGSYGAVAQGQVTMGNPLTTYRIDVAAGQVMILAFAGAGTMRGSVQCQGGVGGGPYNGSGDSIAITTSGPCDLTVGANTMAEPWSGGFTLAVLVYTPPKNP
jgi:hypothetical protein